MVLIRKRYFVQHLEHLESQKRSRRRTVNRLRRLLPWSVGPGAADEQMSIEVKGPTPGHTTDDHIRAFEGIGAALVGGGITGIGLGVALGAPPQDGTGADASTNTTAADHTNEVVQSPKSASFEFIDREDGRPGIVADVQSFTSSPRSGAIPLPLSPGEQSAMPTIHASALSPRVLRARRGS